VGAPAADWRARSASRRMKELPPRSA
jgi:hypothetical protein